MSPKRKPRKKLGRKVGEFIHGDKALMTFFFGMLTFGAIMIFDASVYQADQPPFNDPFHFLKLHLIWIMIGLVPATLIYVWDYRKMAKLISPVLLINIAMLIAVLIFGQGANGSKRWLALGSDQLVIQPAEFIKPVFIVYIATWLAKETKSFKTFKDSLRLGFTQKIAGFGFILSFIMLLVLLEPDLGTTLMIGITAFAVFFASGTDAAHFVGSIMISGVFGLMGVIAAIVAPYRLGRVRTYIDLLLTGRVADPQGGGYQIQQILIGIGSAGFWGKGFGQSRQRFGFLVELTAFTDSIFAVMLEELGMFGGMLFILAWVFFLRKGLEIARHAPDRQGRLMAVGITVWLTMQAFLNIAANVALIPITGIPLPFMTYGGSSTIVTMAGLALLLNISRFREDVR